MFLKGGFGNTVVRQSLLQAGAVKGHVMCDNQLLVDVGENLRPNLVESGLIDGVFPMDAVYRGEAAPDFIVRWLHEQIQFGGNDSVLNADDADLADAPAFRVAGFEVDGGEVHL